MLERAFFAVVLAAAASFLLTAVGVFATAQLYALVKERTPYICDAGSRAPAYHVYLVGNTLSAGLFVASAAIYVLVTGETALSIAILVVAVGVACAMIAMAALSMDTRPKEHNNATSAFFSCLFTFQSLFISVEWHRTPLSLNIARVSLAGFSCAVSVAVVLLMWLASRLSRGEEMTDQKRQRVKTFLTLGALGQYSYILATVAWLVLYGFVGGWPL